jgi:hypothetical protein
MEPSKPQTQLNGETKHTTHASTHALANGIPTWNLIDQSYNLLQTGILDNPLIAPSLPKNAAEYAKKITFTGHERVSIPIVSHPDPSYIPSQPLGPRCSPTASGIVSCFAESNTPASLFLSTSPNANTSPDLSANFDTSRGASPKA